MLRRLGAMLLTLVVSSFVIFGGMYAAPGNPINFLIANPEDRTPARVAQVRAQYHLNDSFFHQYLSWLRNLLHGDLGTSFFYQQPVARVLGSKLQVTITLVVMAAIMFVVIGVLLGAVSALRRNSAADSFITGATTLATSIPHFVSALLLVSVFAVQLRWFDVSGSGSGFGDRLYHLVLPATSLALGALAVVCRVTRQTMVEQQSLEHVEVARSFGLPTRTIVRRHVLRNSLGPVLTMCGLIFASMLAGTIVIESVFGLNGVGSLLLNSINAHDFPVVQAILLYMVIAYMAVTTLIDLLYPLIDPRTLARSESA